MNIFAYQDRYRTVTSTSYTGIQGCSGCQICMHLARGQPSVLLKASPYAYNTWKRELPISLQTRDVHSVARVRTSVYLLERTISRLSKPKRNSNQYIHYRSEFSSRCCD